MTSWNKATIYPSCHAKQTIDKISRLEMSELSSWQNEIHSEFYIILSVSVQI